MTRIFFAFSEPRPTLPQSNNAEIRHITERLMFNSLKIRPYLTPIKICCGPAWKISQQERKIIELLYDKAGQLRITPYTTAICGSGNRATSCAASYELDALRGGPHCVWPAPHRALHPAEQVQPGAQLVRVEACAGRKRLEKRLRTTSTGGIGSADEEAQPPMRKESSQSALFSAKLRFIPHTKPVGRQQLVRESQTIQPPRQPCDDSCTAGYTDHCYTQYSHHPSLCSTQKKRTCTAVPGGSLLTQDPRTKFIH